MAYTFKLNDHHDLSINSKGMLESAYGANEVGQRVIVALRHNYNEYFLNVPGGVPWQEVILGSRDRKTAELIIRSKILEVPGVLGIISLSLNFTNSSRELQIYADVEVQGNKTVRVDTHLASLTTLSGQTGNYLIGADDNYLIDSDNNYLMV